MPGKYTRKFKVSIEGMEEPILVASLLEGQTEEFLNNQAEALKETDETKRNALLVKNLRQLVVSGLNNADSGDTWDDAKVKAQLDKQQVDAVMNEIMKRSGLSVPKATAPETSST